MVAIVTHHSVVKGHVLPDWLLIKIKNKNGCYKVYAESSIHGNKKVRIGPSFSCSEFSKTDILNSAEIEKALGEHYWVYLRTTTQWERVE